MFFKDSQEVRGIACRDVQERNELQQKFSFLRPLFTRTSNLIILLFFVMLVAGVDVWAQPVQRKDTTIVLLADLNTQLECTQALSDLYNFKFDEAEFQFKYLKARYKWHPLPYFLMGLIQWWKIMPNTKNTAYDDVFLAYMDSTIDVSRKSL